MEKCSASQMCKDEHIQIATEVHFSSVKSTKTKRKPDATMVALEAVNTYSLLVTL